MSLVRSGFTIGIFTFISRIFGLLRELVIANFFGTTLYGDIVNTAFKLPNLFRRIFGEGALASVFVPIYTSLLTQDKKSASKFGSEVYTMLFVCMVIITSIIMIYMNEVIVLITPGFLITDEKYELAILVCRITMPYMILISMASLIGSVMSGHFMFGTFAFAPVILNIAVISSSFFGDDQEFKAIYISYGIILGGVLQFTFMYVIMRSAHIHIHFVRIRKLSSNTITFLKNMIPAIIGSSATQLNLFISHGIASFIPGAISIISYSDRIYQFPLSIIGICFGMVLLPHLSYLYKQNQIKEATELQTDAIKLSLFLSFASMFGLISLAHPIIHVIYERGMFNPFDTIKTSQTIAVFALGLPAFILNKILTPIFFANLDTKTPLRITTVTIIINISLNLLLIRNFQHIGIALGTSVASWINIGLIVYYCKKAQIRIISYSINTYILKLVFSCLIMSSILVGLVNFFPHFIYSQNLFIKFSSLIIFIMIGGAFFIVLSQIIGIFKISDIKYLFKKST